jgi:uncharacterized membrane protein YeaQ/YmgE (transglycosylase-associated protein family)
MNAFIWCAVGVLTACIAMVVMPARGLSSRVESVLVAMFGAFVGGEFLASMLSGGVTANGVFRASSLGLAVAGASLMLLLLAVLRRWAGPLRPHKVRRKSRP